LADCADILGELPDYDSLVIDPPYGLREAAGKNKSRGLLAKARDYGNDSWDNAVSDEALISALRARAKSQMIFGGNYYSLPPTSCWLVWDKLTNGDFADCELIWTNLPKAVRRLVYRWNGMLRENKEPRGDHPTQKPIGVMRWAIGHLPEGASVICDAFMGSGTTGVAAQLEGKQFIGVEREQKYFDVACSRIDTAIKHPEQFAKYVAK
jgi:DNA modification methylase